MAISTLSAHCANEGEAHTIGIHSLFLTIFENMCQIHKIVLLNTLQFGAGKTPLAI